MGLVKMIPKESKKKRTPRSCKGKTRHAKGSWMKKDTSTTTEEMWPHDRGQEMSPPDGHGMEWRGHYAGDERGVQVEKSHGDSDLERKKRKKNKGAPWSTKEE